MTEKTGAIHEAYLLCQKTFDPSIELLDESTNITDAEELRFFRTMSNFHAAEAEEDHKRGLTTWTTERLHSLCRCKWCR